VAREVKNGWELRGLDQDITGPAPVVWRERPGKYDDVYGEKTIKATNPVIVLCAYESWGNRLCVGGQSSRKDLVSRLITRLRLCTGVHRLPSVVDPANDFL
jgi:hypothetical protein